MKNSCKLKKLGANLIKMMENWDMIWKNTLKIVEGLVKIFCKNKWKVKKIGRKTQKSIGKIVKIFCKTG